MDKILIIGCSAAGKSTVARELGNILNLDVVHMDKEMWRPGCQLAPPHEEPEVVRKLLERPRWIIDGNYTASLPMRLLEADTVVMVDFPRWLCLLRAMKRLVMYRGTTRPDMGNGCPETFNLNFLKWIWRYPDAERPTLLKQLRDHGSHANLIILRGQRQTDRWLNHLRRATTAPTIPPRAHPA